jgi:hypothetical protein
LERDWVADFGDVILWVDRLSRDLSRSLCRSERLLIISKVCPYVTSWEGQVSRTKADDLGVVIQRPMDLQTIMRLVKGHKYKTKAEFAADLDLIWDNCAYYNTLEVSTILNDFYIYSAFCADGKLDSPGESRCEVHEAEGRSSSRISGG